MYHSPPTLYLIHSHVILNTSRTVWHNVHTARPKLGTVSYIAPSCVNKICLGCQQLQSIVLYLWADFFPTSFWILPFQAWTGYIKLKPTLCVLVSCKACLFITLLIWLYLLLLSSDFIFSLRWMVVDSIYRYSDPLRSFLTL